VELTCQITRPAKNSRAWDAPRPGLDLRVVGAQQIAEALDRLRRDLDLSESGHLSP
jgi:hypothetical protein